MKRILMLTKCTVQRQKLKKKKFKNLRSYLPVVLTATAVAYWQVFSVRSTVLNREQKCLSSHTEHLLLDNLRFNIYVFYENFLY